MNDSYTHNTNPYYAPRPLRPEASTNPYLSANYAAPQKPPSFQSHNPAASPVEYRDVIRTPSPTPSEAEELSDKRRSGLVRILSQMDAQWFRDPKNVLKFVLALVVVGALIAFLVEENRIIDALQPASTWLKKTPGAWLIPIGIMIIMSFPPLFGHEIVAILCGVVWGVGLGFAIVAAGTVLGEICTYLAFRYGCKARIKKLEEKSLQYALLSEVVRVGGVKIAVVARYSAIPAHLGTAVFASAGMSFWIFLFAAIVSLPKQLAVVYLGVSDHGGTVTKTTKIIKVVVIAATIVITIAAMRYMRAKTDEVKGRVIYARRKARQAKMLAASSVSLPDAGSNLDVERQTYPSASDVALNPAPAYAPPSYPPSVRR